MGFGQAIKSVYSNYAKFSGRATRSEFWWFYLFYVIVLVVLNFIDGLLGWKYGSYSFDVTNNGEVTHYSSGGVVGVLYTIFYLATLIPFLALIARRLHDAGHSGLWIIWGALLCCVGWIILIIFWCQPSQPGDTKYGPQPVT